MYLSKIRVKDYKSFRDSGEIEFKPGINIIVGQNNSGKTALLEALSLRFESKPHKSLKNISRAGLWRSSDKDLNKNELQSKVEVSITISSEEVFQLKNERVSFPVFAVNKNINGQVQESFGELPDYFLRLKNPIEIQFNHDGLNVELNHIKDNFINKEIKNLVRVEQNASIAIAIKDNGEIELIGNIYEGKPDFSYRFSRTFSSRIYKFQAERICKSGCIVGASQELKPNAENLAEVLLNTITKRSQKYRELIEYVSEVIPSVKWITSVRIDPPPTGQAPWHEIEVITTVEEASVSLSECGTGIGQVLAILYVIVTSDKDTPRTIIIDEPNSFLHPAASQKLIQILSRFPQHQYFISTHSPEIITASTPATITMLNYIDGETKVEQIDLSNADGLKKVFKVLGVEPATFAFANHILWVEGSTEEKAFSLLLKDIGINNVVVKPTIASAFRQSKKRKKNIRHIFNLHEAVSGTDSVISPKMTILLDREIGKELENEGLIKEFGKDKFNFIPYAMYENYLLDAQAITHILGFTKTTENYEEKSEETDVEVNVENVKNWIAENYKEFLSDKSKDLELDNSECLVKLDGAKLLDKLYKCFLGKPFGYEPYKVEYGEKLTQWLLENKPEQFAELKDFLINLISDKKSS